MRMTWFTWTLLACFISSAALCQSPMPSIKEMRWGRDYQLHVSLSNDTNYVVDIRALPAAGEHSFNPDEETTTFYPVSLDEEFIDYIKSRKLETERQEKNDTTPQSRPKTLWSALHGTLGGGYVHFVNCLIYSLESQQLNLYDPIMRRPVTSWKPKPRTKTYKRTRKWEYYIPHNQRLARREYRLRKREGDLRDLQGVPSGFIEAFLSTSQRDFEQLGNQGKRMQVAQIELIRLLLGAKYLGQEQIEFIQNMVTSAVLRYSVSNLPSVIMFDDYNAAVAMTLDKSGYKIDYVVFRDQNTISADEESLRIERIEALIDAINEANEKVFQKRLSTYYGS